MDDELACERSLNPQGSWRMDDAAHEGVRAILGRARQRLADPPPAGVNASDTRSTAAKGEALGTGVGGSPLGTQVAA